MSVDFLLESDTHDLDLSSGINLTQEGKESLGQKVKVALLLRTTEWSPNINVGVPYRQSILVGKGNQTFIDSYLQDYILRIPEVGSLRSFSSEVNRERQYKVNFSVVGDSVTTNLEVVI